MPRLIRQHRRAWIGLLWLMSVAMAWAAEPAVFSFGVTPQHSAAEQVRLWVPICQYLSKQTGYQIQFKTSKDLPAYWKEADAGAFDLIYINPYYFAKAQKAAGYHALAKDGGTPLIGIIVARRDGPPNVGALRGAKVATHSISAFMTQYVRFGYLRDQDVQIEPVGVGSLESVYLTLDKGLYPAGISIQRAFGLLDPAMQARFKILWQSEPLPPFAYGVHPRVSPTVVTAIQTALHDMKKNPEGRALLAAVNVPSIEPAKDSDFDSVRKLKLE